MKFRLIVNVGDVPLHSIVTKVTGQKRYTVLDQMRVFGTDGQPLHTFKTDPTTRFLVANGDGNAVSADTKVVWEVDAGQAIQFIEERADDEEDEDEA